MNAEIHFVSTKVLIWKVFFLNKRPSTKKAPLDQFHKFHTLDKVKVFSASQRYDNSKFYYIFSASQRYDNLKFYYIFVTFSCKRYFMTPYTIFYDSLYQISKILKNFRIFRLV